MATLSQFGIPGAGFGILQPKLRYRWQVTFVGLGRLVPAASSREITRQATNINRPNITWEEVTIHRYNTTSYVAGKHSWQTIDFTVEDDLTGLASQAIQAQVETQTRIIGADLPANWLNSAASGSDYKFGTILQQLDGNEGVVETWKLEGCFFTAVNYNDLDYSDGSGAVNINVTMRYDHARQELTGQGYGTALAGNL